MDSGENGTLDGTVHGVYREEVDEETVGLEKELEQVRREKKKLELRKQIRLEKEELKKMQDENAGFARAFVADQGTDSLRNRTSAIFDNERKILLAVEAASKGNLQKLQRLQTEGVDLSRGDYDDRTPLHLAAAAGHLQIATFLLDECDVDTSVRDRWNKTALHQAETSGNTTIVAKIKQHNAGSMVDAIMATKNGDLRRLKMLQECGVNIKGTWTDGRTLLHLACGEGHSDIVSYLLEECQASLDCKDRWNRTPTDVAKEAGHFSILRIIRLFKEKQ